MRIVQVANFVHEQSGGVRVAIDELGVRYARAGHEVMSIRPGGRHHLARDELRRVFVELPGVPLPASGGYRVFVRRSPLAAVVASWRPDVVEVHDTTTLAWLGPFARGLGATTAMIAHERLGLVLGDHLGGRHVVHRATSWRHRRVVDGFDHVIAPSRFAAQELAGVAPVRVVPLGVDLAVFRPERRHAIHRPPRPRRIVLASRLSREKRPVLAVQAVNELHWQGVDAELLVAGDGPQHGDVLAAGAGGPLRMLGHVADRRHLAALLADADVLVSPGPRETFGLAALEALACGTPVVCVDEGAVGELLVEGAGTACRADPRTLAAGLASTLAGDRGSQRVSARRRAEQFSWERTAAMMLEGYSAPASARPSRS